MAQRARARDADALEVHNALELQPNADEFGDGKYEPRSRVVSRVLREAILDGRLQPGVRLRQEALANRLGTSRIPVRESLLELEAEGLITMIPHSGARVAKLDSAECTETYRMREVIEPMALAESVPLLTDEQIDKVCSHHVAVEEAAGAHDAHRWLAEDREFHLAAYAGAPMPRARRMIEGFWNTTQHYRRAYLSTLTKERIELVNCEHRLLIDALRRRDATEAASLLAIHIRRTRVTLSTHPELFEGGRPAEGEIHDKL
jgi:DNA-binding GntR family transcriptional regulator